MTLKYHQSTFDLIGKEPRPSAKARKILEARERALGITLPPSLKEFYSIAGASKILEDHSNGDPAIAIEELGDPDDVAHGVLLFQVENQSVAAWYVRLDGSDDPPVVVDTEGNRRPPPADKDWDLWDVVEFVTETDHFSDFVYKRVLTHGGDKRDRKTAAKLAPYGGQVTFGDDGRAEEVFFDSMRGEKGLAVPAEAVDEQAMTLVRRLDRLKRLSIPRPPEEVTGWAVIRDHPGITCLEASQSLDDPAAEHVATMPALREIRVGVALGDQGLTRLLSGLRLDTIELEVTERITPRGLSSLASQSGLSRLQLSDMGENLTDEGLEGLAGLSSLKHLLIFTDVATDVGLKHIAGLVGLNVLKLCMARLTDAGLEHLAGLSELTELRFQRTQALTGTGFRWLSKMSALRLLDASGRPIIDAALKHLACLTSLEVLNLGGSKIVGPGLDALASLPKLRELDLGYCPLNDEDLHRLADSSSLEELNLTLTQVTDAGVISLAPLRSLRSLNVTGGRVSAEAIRELAAAIPSLTHVRWTPPGIREDIGWSFDFQAKPK